MPYMLYGGSHKNLASSEMQFVISLSIKFNALVPLCLIFFLQMLTSKTIKPNAYHKPYCGRFFGPDSLGVRGKMHFHELFACIRISKEHAKNSDENKIYLDHTVKKIKEYLPPNKQTFPFFDEQRNSLANTPFQFYNEKVVNHLFYSETNEQSDFWSVLIHLATLLTLNSIQIYDYDALGNPKTILIRPQKQPGFAPSIVIYEYFKTYGSNVVQLDDYNYKSTPASSHALLIMSDHGNHYGDLNEFARQVSDVEKYIQSMGATIITSHIKEGYGFCPLTNDHQNLDQKILKI